MNEDIGEEDEPVHGEPAAWRDADRVAFTFSHQAAPGMLQSILVDR